MKMSRILVILVTKQEEHKSICEILNKNFPKFVKKYPIHVELKHSIDPKQTMHIYF